MPNLTNVLAVVGDLLDDIVVRIAMAPVRGTDTPAHIERRRGGSAANVAAWAARAGAPVRFIGRVGEDELGERLVRDLVGDGVEVLVQRRGRSGSVVVLVGPDGERTMLPDRASAVELVDVDAAWIDGVTWLHVPSYSLLSEPIGTTVTAMIAALRRAGGRLSVDVSSVAIVESFGIERYNSLLADLTPDVVFTNEPESHLLRSTKPALTIIKSGPRPVCVLDGDEVFEVEVRALRAAADSTGAGDAFAGGYLAAAMQSQDVRRCVHAGIDAAARLLSR